MQTEDKNIVILGAGFGGLAAASGLAGKSGLHIKIIDRKNHHLFQPLLYQVATAGLGPAEISSTIRSRFSQFKNTEVIFANVEAINPGMKKVITTVGEFSYDILVVACGAMHNYFGNEQWEKYAPGLKTLEHATEIRRRILTAFEMAEAENNPERKKSFLTFVIVGGGPTGVELAGAIGELNKYTLKKDFRKIDSGTTRIILVEGGKRILSTFSEKSSQEAVKVLHELGVEIKTSTMVSEINEDGVVINNETIFSETVIWAAGVKPSELNQFLAKTLDKTGRVKVQMDLSLPDFPEIFVIGDQAHFENEEGNVLPGLAPVALQQGRQVAKNILADVYKEGRGKFVYHDKGQLATIGRRRAVLEIGKFKAHGFFAWVCWIVVHIYYLIGFKNRLFVLLEWFRHYITYQGGSRLIVQKEWRTYLLSKNKKAHK